MVQTKMNEQRDKVTEYKLLNINGSREIIFRIALTSYRYNIIAKDV